jgi:hypothetical protein
MKIKRATNETQQLTQWLKQPYSGFAKSSPQYGQFASERLTPFLQYGQ